MLSFIHKLSYLFGSSDIPKEPRLRAKLPNNKHGLYWPPVQVLLAGLDAPQRRLLRNASFIAELLAVQNPAFVGLLLLASRQAPTNGRARSSVGSYISLLCEGKAPQNNYGLEPHAYVRSTTKGFISLSQTQPIAKPKPELIFEAERFPILWVWSSSQ